ncbi:MAG: endonuclease/exonuclease/phosphatase family protein [Clostridia bacterium]|nr:endonuclease/exonuclease/phosphatase family protein [Clostridia bacterium]
MKKKILFCLLAVLMLTSLLCACGAEKPQETTATSDTWTPLPGDLVETEPPAPAGLTVIAADGSSSFKIVRAEFANGIIKELAIDLFNTLNETHNGKIGISDDWVKKTDEDGTVTTEDYEILIGDTNRKESSLAKEQLGEYDYIICTMGNKIVIQGKSVFSVKFAVEQFVTKFSAKAGEAMTVDLPEPILGMGSSQGVSLSEGADLRIMTFNVLGSGQEPLKRAPNIQETILTYMPDIVGFQECNSEMHGLVIQQLKDYYTLSQRTHDSGTLIYTPIIYLTEKYTQLDSGVEWLDSRYTGTNTKCIAWSVLKSNETGKIFAVVNMHGAVISTSYKGFETMPAGERSTLVNQWRVDNVRQMLDIRAAIQTKHGKIAVMFIGDFNFNSDSDAYRATKAAGLTEAEVSATGKKTTGYASYSGTAGVAPGTGKSIDHVFYHPDEATALRHHIARNEVYEYSASDHCAVWADMKIH